MPRIFRSRSLGYLVGLAAVAGLAAGYALAASSHGTIILQTPPAAAMCHDCAQPYAKLPLDPPAGFNPLKATDAQLDVYGFPPRPDAAKAPADYAVWAKAVSAHATRIIPQLRATKIYNGPVKRLSVPNGTVRNGVTGATSNNWSGYVISDSTNPFAATNTRISGVFIVPTAQEAFGTCSSNWVYSSQWIGLDGFNSSDVFQAGSETWASCINGTTVAYYGVWYEWYPTSEVQIANFPVSPGDEIYLYIWNTSSTTGKLYLLDETKNTLVRLSFSAPGGTQLTGNSAEWIVERPGIDGGLATLTNYISDEWEDAIVNAGGGGYSAAAPTAHGKIYSLTMLDDSSAPISTASTSEKNLKYTAPDNSVTTTAGTALWFADEGSARGP